MAPRGQAVGTVAAPAVTHRVSVRLFAGVRAAAAGTHEVGVDVVPGQRVGDVLTELTRLHPGTATVLPACSMLLDGVRARLDTPVGEARTVDVLPPFSGG